MPERGAVRRDGTRILIGPEASDDAIATIACRRLLELQTPNVTERAVRAEVRRWGFRYRLATAQVRRITVPGDCARTAQQSA